MLKLTEWGKFVNRHSVCTSIDFWQDLRREVIAMAEEDSDFDVLFDERLAGIKEFRERMYEFMNE